MADRRRSSAPEKRGKGRPSRAGRSPVPRPRSRPVTVPLHRPDAEIDFSEIPESTPEERAAFRQPPPVATTAHEPRHDIAEAVAGIADRLRERLMAAGIFQAEVAAQFERLAQILAAVAGGHPLPPLLLTVGVSMAVWTC